jgi:hypothetical protein
MKLSRVNFSATFTAAATGAHRAHGADARATRELAAASKLTRVNFDGKRFRRRLCPSPNSRNPRPDRGFLLFGRPISGPSSTKERSKPASANN